MIIYESLQDHSHAQTHVNVLFMIELWSNSLEFV